MKQVKNTFQFEMASWMVYYGWEISKILGNIAQMPRPKIDLHELKQLLAEGNSKAIIAQKLGVAPSSITKAAQKLASQVPKTATFERDVQLTEFLNTIAEQVELYRDLKLLWRFWRDAASGKKRALNRLNRIYLVLKLEKVTDPSRLAVRAVAEMRQQLKLHADMLAQYFTPKSYQEFMEELIEVLQSVDRDVAHALLDALKEKYPVQRSLHTH